MERAQAARAHTERAQAARDDRAHTERAQAARDDRAHTERAQAARGDRTHTEPDPLLSLQQQSLKLGRIALVGSREDKAPPTVRTVLLLKQLERMKQQKFVLENRIRAGEFSTDDFPQENLTMEFLTQTIASLEKEIEKLKVGYQNKALFLRRMQLYDAIHRKLLEKDTESKQIYETIEHSKDLGKQILKLQKETLPLEEKLIAVRKKRLELKKTCAALMAELKDENDRANSNFAQMENQYFKKINKYIAKENDIVTVIQNVFQRLILGSKVDWAEDPKLREIVLTLGKSPA